MNVNNVSSSETWIRSLPVSKIMRPETVVKQIQYFFWRLYTPYHPRFRDTLLALHIVKHEGRQNFLLGYVPENLSLEEFSAHLVERGFGNHFIAWQDEGEVVSLRYVENFERQYHLRVFKDREVRGHYEYTPESHPFWHMKEIELEERRPEFLNFLGDIITPIHK